MKISFNGKVTWNLPKKVQYEDYEYSPGLCCPDCSRKPWYRWMEENRYDIVGYCEVNGELQVCCECHVCGSKYRYHLSKHYLENYQFDVERWQQEVALHLYLNQETYKRFEV